MNTPILREQVAKAGVRLAHMLENGKGVCRRGRRPNFFGRSPSFVKGHRDHLKVGQTRSHNSLHDAPTVAFVNGLIDSMAEYRRFDTLEARRFSAVDAHHGNTWTTLFWWREP